MTSKGHVRHLLELILCSPLPYSINSVQLVNFKEYFRNNQFGGGGGTHIPTANYPHKIEANLVINVVWLIDLRRAYNISHVSHISYKASSNLPLILEVSRPFLMIIRLACGGFCFIISSHGVVE